MTAAGHSVKASGRPYDWAADEALTEPEGHGRQGDPGRAEAKSSPEFRPETPSGSVSADPVFDIVVDGARNLWGKRGGAA